MICQDSCRCKNQADVAIESPYKFQNQKIIWCHAAVDDLFYLYTISEDVSIERDNYLSENNSEVFLKEVSN